MEQWYVYILRLDGDEYYVGCSANVARRYRQHWRGFKRGGYLVYSSVVDYVGCVALDTKRDALEMEKLLQQFVEEGALEGLVEELGDLFDTSWPPPKCTVANTQLPRYGVRR